MPACLRISFRYLSIFTLPSCILLANKIKVFQKNHATISANLSYPMTADPAMFQIASFPSSRISSTSSRTSSVPVIMLAQKSHIVKSLFIFLIFLLKKRKRYHLDGVFLCFLAIEPLLFEVQNCCNDIS